MRRSHQIPRRALAVCACLFALLLTAGAVLAAVEGAEADTAQEPTATPAAGASEISEAPAESEPVLLVEGMKVSIDPATGKVGPVSRAEALELSARLRQMLSRSPDGLQSRTLKGGAIALDLQGRYMNAAIARLDDDGKLVTDCVHSLAEAEKLVTEKNEEEAGNDR